MGSKSSHFLFYLVGFGLSRRANPRKISRRVPFDLCLPRTRSSLLLPSPPPRTKHLELHNQNKAQVNKHKLHIIMDRSKEPDLVQVIQMEKHPNPTKSIIRQDDSQILQHPVFTIQLVDLRVVLANPEEFLGHLENQHPMEERQQVPRVKSMPKSTVQKSKFLGLFLELSRLWGFFVFLGKNSLVQVSSEEHLDTDIPRIYFHLERRVELQCYRISILNPLEIFNLSPLLVLKLQAV